MPLRISFILTISLFVFLFSCSKDQPLLTEDIEALVKSLETGSLDCSCDPFLDEYKLNKSAVYVLAFSAPNCNWVPTYYDENGQIITSLQSTNWSECLQAAQRVRNVWTCGG